MTLGGLIQRCRRWRLTRRGVSIGHGSYVHSHVSFAGWPRVYAPGVIQIGPACELGRGAELNPWGGHIHIGRRVFVGPYTVIYGQGGVVIGDNCLISMHCCILSSNHAIPPRDRLVRDEPDILLPTRIDNDCWIGAGAKILGGVHIGEGCIVGAGAVVTKSLPPYSIAVGNPARIIGHRP